MRGPPEEHAGAPVVQQLADAVEGLLYSSESDRPFVVFFRDAGTVPEPLTARSFAQAIGASPDDHVEERSLDSFLRRHIDLVDPSDDVAWGRIPRYERLRRLLASLSGVRVFRIGRVEVRCFAVGHDVHGNLAGVETVAVET